MFAGKSLVESSGRGGVDRHRGGQSGAGRSRRERKGGEGERETSDRLCGCVIYHRRRAMMDLKKRVRSCHNKLQKLELK